jgi:hypothetical protein
MRRSLHLMRFHWLQHEVLRLQPRPQRIFELGCYNCRSLEYLPSGWRAYVGADAGSPGLQQAMERYRGRRDIELCKALTAADLHHLRGRRFDLSISLETLEHVPAEHLAGYLDFLAEVTSHRLLVTVPVEVGLVFLGRYVAKSLYSPLREGRLGVSYSARDAAWLTFGRADKVQRRDHKGFDWRALARTIERRFEIAEIVGLPFRSLPMLSFQVGIVAKPSQSRSTAP